MTTLYNVGDIVFAETVNCHGVITFINEVGEKYHITVCYKKNNKIYEKEVYIPFINHYTNNSRIYKLDMTKVCKEQDLFKLLIAKSNFIKLQKS